MFTFSRNDFSVGSISTRRACPSTLASTSAVFRPCPVTYGLAATDELAAAGDRDDDLVRQLPAQLLDGLERQSLRPLRIEGPDVDVAEGPRGRLDQLAAEPVHLVVVAPNRDHVGIEHADADDLRRLEVDGDEDEALEPSTRRVGRHRVGQVPCRRAGNRLEAVGPRPTDRDRDNAVLERIGGVHAVVLQVEVSKPQLGTKPVRFYQRREALPERDHRRRILNREQVPIAPHRCRALCDAISRDLLLQRRVVENDVHGPKAHLADVGGLELILRLAFATAQPEQLGHNVSLESALDRASAAGLAGVPPAMTLSLSDPNPAWRGFQSIPSTYRKESSRARSARR